jgi:hypothetical protein
VPFGRHLYCLYITARHFPSLPYALSLTCIEASTTWRESSMLDLLMLVIGFACFALTIGYAVVCDRL